MQFYYRVTQTDFENAFSGVSAEKAAAMILGDCPLSEEQQEVLERAQGNCSYGCRFDPEPVGHIAFIPIDTQGQGNRGRHLLAPATIECRKLVNKKRRLSWDKQFQNAGAPQGFGNRLFTILRGHVPTLNVALELYPILKTSPKISNKELRNRGLRPRHPVEGRAISALRKALLAPPHTPKTIKHNRHYSIGR